jgi:uncharacterized membrane protein
MVEPAPDRAASTASIASPSRLDAFVDAAFAFAVTLLVVGVGSVPATLAELMAAGLLSVTFAQFRATAALSPWVYALLPVAIGLFAWRYDWSGERSVQG